MSQERSQSSADKEPFLVTVIIHLQETKVIQVQPSAPGRKAPAPKITKESLQKAFDFDFESLDSSLYEFWKCGLRALGPHFDGPYKAIRGSNVMFKWRVDGRAERLGTSVETEEEYNSMKQGIESHCATIVCIEVKDTDLAVFRVSSDINVDMNPPAVDSGGAGYAMASRAPNVQDLTPLEAAQAKHTVALKARWKCSLHLGDWCYRRHMDDYCIRLNVAAFGIWARAIYEDTASVENPPNVKYFDLASHRHRNTQSERAESASGGIATSQFLELLTAVIKHDTPHMTMALPMPPVTLKQPDTQPPVRHNLNASEHLSSPGVRTAAGNVEDIDLFIAWCCENNQGNYSSFRDTMIEQELYPDDMVPDLSNKDLCECIPFLKVSAVPCFRKACAGYWKHRLRLSKALRLNRHRRDSDANLPARLAHDPPIRTFPSSIRSLPSPAANTNTTSSMNSNPIMIVNTGTGSTNMSITSPPISTHVDPIFSTSLPIPNPLPPSPSNLQTRGDSSIEFSVGQKHPLPEPADDGWRRCERIYPEGGGYTLWYQYDQENQTWGDGEGGTAHSTQQNTDYLTNLQEQAGKEGCIDRMQNPNGSWTRMEPGRFNPISF